MCGICGSVGRAEPAAVRRMTRAMVHRGPDDESYYDGTNATLGFRRLAIIDVAGGRQPLVNEDGSIRVVFNGEIYNHRELRSRLQARGHRLASGSDGEVLAHLYEETGDGLVADLNGIFAFALWDERRGRRLLARDPNGVKPLYYTDEGGCTVFASEIKSMVAGGLVSTEIDPEAVAQYLTYQAVPAPCSILSTVRALPPGTVAARRPGGHDAALRARLQDDLGLSFLPRLWRRGLASSIEMGSGAHDLWRPLLLATHELVSQADRLAAEVGA